VFFGLAGELLHQILVMLGCDAEIGSGQSDALLALAAFAVGIGAAGFCRGGHAAVVHGDFALVEILDAKGIAEGAGELLLRASGFSWTRWSDLMARELS